MKSSTARICRMIPQRRTTSQKFSTHNTTSFFIFSAKLPPGLFYAIHDEDALEFPYMLRDKGPERMLSGLQHRDLLPLAARLTLGSAASCSAFPSPLAYR